MIDAKPVDSPVTFSDRQMCEEKLDAKVPYREAVGSLMYATNIARIDIAFAVNRVSRQVASPTKVDWEETKRIFRYLADKQEMAIVYSSDNKRGLEAYCDADFAGDARSSRSTTGIVILFGGAPIHWRSSLQKLVTLSSTEAELVSLCTVTKDIMWLRKIAEELDIIAPDEPIPIYCDNESAIKIVTRRKAMQRTRHLSARTGYVAEQIENKKISVHHVKTDNQLADMLTKATIPKTFRRNCSMLMKSMSIMMMLFMTLALVANGLIFDRVAPLVWTDMNTIVQRDTRDYEIDLRVTSPCPLLAKIMHESGSRKRRAARYLVQGFGQDQSPYKPLVQVQTQSQYQQPVQVLTQSQYQPPVQQFDQNIAPEADDPSFGMGSMTIVGERPVQRPVHTQTDLQKAHDEAYSYCNSIYSEYIEQPLNELKTRTSKGRNRRSLTGMITGFFVSNVLTTLLDKFV